MPIDVTRAVTVRQIRPRVMGGRGMLFGRNGDEGVGICDGGML